MSETLINNWLNDELDEQSMVQLEHWLREDPEQLQTFFDAVTLQEELRLHYGGTPVTVTLPPQQRRGIRLIVSLSAAAALIAAFLVIPRASDPQPTADPLVWVLAGNPQVEITRIDPGPNPVFIPREKWPVETQVTTSDELSTVRWGEDCVLDAGPGTILTLRSAPDGAVPTEPRSIRLKGGSLTVRLAAPAVRVDILVGDSRVRAGQPVDFTLEIPGPKPGGPDAVLSVTRGKIELSVPDANKRSVAAGDRVSLP